MKKTRKAPQRVAAVAGSLYDMAVIEKMVAKAAEQLVGDRVIGSRPELAMGYQGKIADAPYAGEASRLPQPMTQRPASAVLGAHVEATHSLASRVCHIVARLAGPVPENAGGKGAVAQAAGLIPDAIDQADYAVDAIRRAHAELDRLEAAL